eukprot:COSAG04_NODE_660_length_11451_cov_7.123238_10_plen_68_part_00
MVVAGLMGGHGLKHLAVNGTLWTFHAMVHGRRRIDAAGQTLMADTRPTSSGVVRSSQRWNRLTYDSS